MPVKSRYSGYIRLIAVVMLFAMFHYVAGYRLIYSLGIIRAKHEAKEIVTWKNNNLKKFTLTTGEFYSLKWSEENKEFSLNNEMYDVLNIQKSGNNFVVTTCPDNDETEWLMAFHNFEKELFQPDQSTNGTKSADDVMSAFQKDFKTVSTLQMHFFACTGLLLPLPVVQQQPLQTSDNIWHPPASC